MSKYRRKEELEDDTSYSQEFEAQAAVDSEPKEPEEASFKKRYGDLRRHTQQLMSQKDQELEKLQTQLDSAAKGQIKFPKTDEEIEEWTKKYPDVSKIVNTIARKHANEALEEGEKRLGHLKDLETKLTAFHDWVIMQPQNMQDALYKNNTDAMAASRAIDLYKADTGKRKTTSKRSAAQAVGRTSSSAPAATGKAKFSESQIARMSDREYEANEEAILQAMRTEGAFIYDMSGGAR